MKRELLASGQGVRHANERGRVISLPTTTPAAVVDVIEGSVVVEEVYGSCIDLSSSAKEAY